MIAIWDLHCCCLEYPATEPWQLMRHGLVLVYYFQLGQNSLNYLRAIPLSHINHILFTEPHRGRSHKLKNHNCSDLSYTTIMNLVLSMIVTCSASLHFCYSSFLFMLLLFILWPQEQGTLLIQSSGTVPKRLLSAGLLSDLSHYLLTFFRAAHAYRVTEDSTSLPV